MDSGVLKKANKLQSEIRSYDALTGNINAAISGLVGGKTKFSCWVGAVRYYSMTKDEMCDWLNSKKEELVNSRTACQKQLDAL